MTCPVTVCIPSIPPRRAMLQRAVESVARQDIVPAGGIEIEIDHNRTGSAATRTRALNRVQTPWVAFLDDDDVWLPEHLRACWDHAQETGADLVFPWYHVIDVNGKPGTDPVGHFGREFNVAAPHLTTICVLVRTELAQALGFQELPGYGVSNDDWRFIVRMCNEGASILGRPLVVKHLARRTWNWHHHGANTSGLSRNW